MKNLFKNKMFGRTLPILSLALMMVGGFFVHVPLAHATTTTVTDYAGLAAAYTAAADGDTILLGASIVLTSALDIGKSITIDGSASKFTLSGKPITITAGAVTLKNMVLTGTENVQPEDDGNYGIMVQGGSLTADNISMTVATDNAANNVGFNVAVGASLSLNASTITIASTGQDQAEYGVYAQSGAVAVTLNTNNTFSFDAPNTSGAYSYLIGTQGDLIANYPTITLTGTNTQNAYMKLLLVGTDTLAHKQAYALAQTIDGERIGVIDTADGVADGIYIRTANSFAVKTLAQFLAALADTGQATITLGANITLSDHLIISRTVIIDGADYTLSGKHVTISSGAVTLKDLVLTGTENVQPDGNYGIMVQGGSLTADNIDITVATSGGIDNDGFNVAVGASLDLKNSTITLTGDTDNQYGVYTQSGAVAVTLTDNTFAFPVRSASPYSYLIGMEGVAVANYPIYTLVGTNTNNAFMKLMLYGADTLENKEAYAAIGNRVAIGQRLVSIGGSEVAALHVRPATGWETPIVATAIAGVTPPVTGATPVTTVTAGTGYTGTVTWSDSPSTFASATVYTATITLAATSGYTLTGVTANQFTIDGATATNSADSGVITAVFPATAAAATVSHSSGGGSGPRCAAGTAYNSSTSSCVSVGGETPATPAVPATHLEGCKPGSGDVFDTTSGKSCTIPATPAGPSSSGLSAPQIQGILDVLASFSADADVIAKVRAALSGTGGTTTTTTTTGSVTSTAVQVFKTNLTMGSLGSEVKALQEFLNSHGYIVSTSGAGSRGNETTFFGRGTSLALIKYQKAKGITPAVGYFGEKTRASVNSGQ